jgi:uncharacterized membrane protein YkoI
MEGAMSLRALFIVGALLAAAAPLAASAQPPQSDSLGANWREQQREAHRGVQGGNVPLAQVIETIRRLTPGRLLDTGIETANGREVYRVRWAADNGRRIDYLVDVKTGAVVSQGAG